MTPSARSNTVPAYMPLGAVIGGKYRIDALLAEGGMGVVYRGSHLVLDQPVAIKVVRPELTNRPDALARFLREARTIAALRGEHVARVLDSGCIKNGPPYMVLEYLEGADLRTWLQSKGPLSIVRAVDLTMQVCEALAEAHGQGLVHRDIKPENLFLTRRPDGTEAIKVLDFGISKRMDDARARSYTAEGQSLGSPHYMGPEQMSAPADVDARADVWSLGVVLFELVSGRLPFDGESVATVCARVICKPPCPLRALCPEAPAGLESAIVRCLGKRPADRFASVCELAEALAPFGTANAAESLARIRRLSGAQPLAAFELTPSSINARLPTVALASTTELDAPRSYRAKRLRPVGVALVATMAAVGVASFKTVQDAASYAFTGVAAAARGESAAVTSTPPREPSRVAAVVAQAPAEPPRCPPVARALEPVSLEELPIESEPARRSASAEKLVKTGAR